MSKVTLSRRVLLQRTVAASAVAASGSLLVLGCGDSGLDCTDVSGLSGPERQTRTTLEYVEESPHGEEKNCVNCRLYTAAAAANQCGTCTVVKGPINPLGYCKSWVIVEAS